MHVISDKHKKIMAKILIKTIFLNILYWQKNVPIYMFANLLYKAKYHVKNTSILLNG